MLSLTSILLAQLLSSPAAHAPPFTSPVALAPVFVSVAHLELDLRLDLKRRWVDQVTVLELKNVGRDTVRVIPFILGRLFTAHTVEQTGAAAAYTQEVVEFTDQPAHQVRALRVTLSAPLAPGASTTVRIVTTGTITGLTEIGYLYVRDRVDSAYTLLRQDAHAWPMPGVPSDSLNRRGARGEFSSRVRAEVPLGYVAASAGRLVGVDTVGARVTWRYVNPARAPFIFVAVAPFATLSSAIATYLYLPEDSEGARELAAAMSDAQALLARWYGPPASADPLTIIEIPEGWGSQASATGGIVLQASAFRDPAQRRELYHELVHLWNPPDVEVPSPRWNEGFSSFLEWLLAEQVDSLGTRAASQDRNVQVLVRRLETVEGLRRVPAAEFGAARMTDQAYTLGRVMFAVLYERVGDETFHRIYRRYRDQFAGGGRAADLEAIAREVGGADAGRIVRDWLLTTHWTSLVGPGVTVAQLAASYR